MKEIYNIDLHRMFMMFMVFLQYIYIYIYIDQTECFQTHFG